MRRIGLVAALVVAFLIVGAPSCQPTEPAMTITAKVGQKPGACGDHVRIEGIVAPASASSRVVLQHTVGGKWVDLAWYKDSDADSTPVLIAGPVNKPGGNYSLYFATRHGDTYMSGTRHYRVRSDKGTAFSPGLYITFPACP